jgi:hypothetical protein
MGVREAFHGYMILTALQTKPSVLRTIYCRAGASVGCDERVERVVGYMGAKTAHGGFGEVGLG